MISSVEELTGGERESGLLLWECCIESLQIFIASHSNAVELTSEEVLLSFLDLGVLIGVSTFKKR